MKENKDIEKILLNDKAYEKMLKTKIEKEFMREIEGAKNQDKIITDIKNAPKDKLFSRFATFEVMNKASKTKSYINGVQAEGYLGIQSVDRSKLINGETDSFVSGNNFIKFIKIRV